jgi:adenosine 3'-phospho 5'-phosphosulfate transporter B2
MFQFPKFVFDCLVLSVCSAAGQLFIYYTIATFGPVVFVIIMTIRQVKKLMFLYRNGSVATLKQKLSLFKTMLLRLYA